MNLGEVTSGLAMLAGLPPHARGIVTGLSVEYTKKARGRLLATCDCVVPDVAEPIEHVVEAIVHDQEDDVVARVAVTWRLDLR